MYCAPAVVPGVQEVRPDVRHVRHVAVVPGLHALGGDELADVLDRREEQVPLDRVVLHLVHRLGHAGELRELDLDVVLVLELLQDLLVDVVVPVVDAQGAGLGGEAVVDRRDVVVERQGHRVVWRGELDAAGAGRRGRAAPARRSSCPGMPRARRSSTEARCPPPPLASGTHDGCGSAAPSDAPCRNPLVVLSDGPSRGLPAGGGAVKAIGCGSR